MKTVEADKAAENFTRLLGQVLADQKSLAIVKEGVPCAYLVPAGEPKCDSHEFAEALASEGLADEDGRAVGASIHRGRKTLNALKNPWG